MSGSAEDHNRQITSLSGTYKVITMPWITDAQCLAVVQALENEGQTPFRSTTTGGSVVALALGGDTVKIAGWEYDVMIFGRTIGIIWQKCPVVYEMERIVEFDRRRKLYVERKWPMWFWEEKFLTPEELAEKAKARRQLIEQVGAERALKEAEAIARGEHGVGES